MLVSESGVGHDFTPLIYVYPLCYASVREPKRDVLCDVDFTRADGIPMQVCGALKSYTHFLEEKQTLNPIG